MGRLLLFAYSLVLAATWLSGALGGWPLVAAGLAGLVFAVAMLVEPARQS